MRFMESKLSFRLIIISILISVFSFANGQESAIKISDTTKAISIVGLIKYPKEAVKKRIQGVVEMKLTFDSSCHVSKKEIVKSLGYGCDEAALSLVKRIESQIKKQNKSKCTQPYEWTVPIKFNLDN